MTRELIDLSSSGYVCSQTFILMVRLFPDLLLILDSSLFDMDLIETDLITLPSVYEMLCRTKLRTDEKDSRIYPNRVPIKIPLNRNKRSSKPN